MTIIVPYPAGSSDSVARLLASRLSILWGQPVVIDNRPGASGVTGMMAARGAAPDGHTLILGLNGPLSANMHLLPKLPYDPLADFAMIAKVAQIPLMIAANPALPYSNLGDLIAAAKKAPGGLEFASPGNGSGSHLAAAMFLSRAGVQMIHVPYKGTGPGITDLLAGHVMLMFTAVGDLAPHVNSGKLNALGVTAKVRAPQWPSVPAVSELYPGFEAVGWAGLLAPKGTPQSIVSKISADLRRVLADPGVVQAVQDLHLIPDFQDSPEFRRYVQSEIESVGKIVREAGIKAN